MSDFDYPYENVVTGEKVPAPTQPVARPKSRVLSFSDEYDLKEILNMSARKRVSNDGTEVRLDRVGLLAKMILERHGFKVELTTEETSLVRVTKES